MKNTISPTQFGTVLLFFQKADALLRGYLLPDFAVGGYLGLAAIIYDRKGAVMFLRRSDAVAWVWGA